jgi:magnesium transporter
MRGIHHPNRYLRESAVTDDTKEKVEFLVLHRIPWLLVGLIGGVTASFIVSRFEDIISRNISLAFFLPLVVYMSDAIGTQTEEIYVRNLALGKVKFFTYLIKNCSLGC